MNFFSQIKRQHFMGDNTHYVVADKDDEVVCLSISVGGCLYNVWEYVLPDYCCDSDCSCGPVCAD